LTFGTLLKKIKYIWEDYAHQHKDSGQFVSKFYVKAYELVWAKFLY